MDRIAGFGGSVICALIAGLWWYHDKPAFMEYGWIVMIGMSAVFFGLVTVFQRHKP